MRLQALPLANVSVIKHGGNCRHCAFDIDEPARSDPAPVASFGNESVLINIINMAKVNKRLSAISRPHAHARAHTHTVSRDESEARHFSVSHHATRQLNKT